MNSDVLIVPEPGEHEKLGTLLRTLQERHWILLYTVGRTRVFGKRDTQFGGLRVYADPGMELFFEGDTLRAAEPE